MKRGSFFARMYGEAGGRIQHQQKSYFNKIKLGDGYINPPNY